MPLRTSRWPSRRISTVVALAALLLAPAGALSGCTSSDPSPRPDASAGPEAPANKNGDGELHHDLEPLTTRIPALADAISATWTSGTLGDDRAPGPSTYWIDAVVVLPPDVADRLRTELDLVTAGGVPQVAEVLVGELPASGLLTGPGLDAAFSADGWYSTAYLADDVLVLQILGQ